MTDALGRARTVLYPVLPRTSEKGRFAGRFEYRRSRFNRWRDAGHRIPPRVIGDGKVRNDRAVLTPVLTRGGELLA